jgi:hypothetical protein
MEGATPAHVLVVTDRPAATPALLDAIHGRAARGPAWFHLLVPNPAAAEWHPGHPERHERVAEAEQELTLALPMMEAAAGRPVEGSVSPRHDPMDAIEEALRAEDYDEIILSSVPHRLSSWLHVDLPHRVAHLGLPVTTITTEPGAGARSGNARSRV